MAMEISDTDVYSFRNEDLFNVWQSERDQNKKTTTVLNYILGSMNETEFSDSYTNKINEKVRHFCSNLSSKWQKCHRIREKFIKKFEEWMKANTTFEKCREGASASSRCVPGRPRLTFDSKSERSKRKQASELANEIGESPELIVQAATMAARRAGQKDLAVVLQETTKSPTRPSKIKKRILFENKDPKPYTPEEALAFLLENRFSKQQYLNIRHGSKARNCDIYPSYKRLLECKSSCRAEGIVVSEIMAKVPLNNLLEHTVRRLITLQQDLILNVATSTSEEIIKAKMILSYGFDGSTGQALYKQKFEGLEKTPDIENSLFASTVIPLRVITESNIILWNNQTPQSVRFCRPLKLEFAKETREHVRNEKASIDEEIQNLRPLEILLENGKKLVIEYNLFMTLIDGKILNILTDTRSNQVCPICGASPLKFSQIKDFKSKIFEPKPNSLQYGISPLHSWIRFFECILHISYRLNVKTWHVRTEENKNSVKQRKLEVQKLFWEKMGLRVDKPRANGSGSTNDGNTARRAFKEIELFSSITGVDKRIISNFKTILIAIACQLPLNLDEFENFCFQTAHIFMEKYPWFPMPATIHKVLIHGKQILANTVLPAGFFGEDAAESRNKFYKQDREFHARKNSRIHNLSDVFNRAMDTSDPLISSLCLKNRMTGTHKQNLPAEVISLLLSPEAEPQPSTSTATVEPYDSDEKTTTEEEESSGFLRNGGPLDDLQLESD